MSVHLSGWWLGCCNKLITINCTNSSDKYYTNSHDWTVWVRRLCKEENIWRTYLCNNRLNFTKIQEAYIYIYIYRNLRFSKRVLKYIIKTHGWKQNGQFSHHPKSRIMCFCNVAPNGKFWFGRLSKYFIIIPNAFKFVPMDGFWSCLCNPNNFLIIYVEEVIEKCQNIKHGLLWANMKCDFLIETPWPLNPIDGIPQ